MKKILVLSLILSGCVGPAAQFPYAKMTAEQIKEAVKDKDIGITCITATYAGAKATTLLVNVDKGIPSNMTVNDDCKLTVEVPKKEK